ncbi:MAG TPA: potassium transporter Kup [Thermoanaerobaculia bacterium]|nr:potassium transporter Kup [Thermoanaerobaculia bacterium]
MRSGDTPDRSRLAFLSLTALGVVYGDIGTSPLYAVRECFFGPHAVPVTQNNVLGVLSLIFWTLVVVVTLKYLVYVLRADNQGEGGILALMALATRTRRRRQFLLIVLGLFGGALLYGDGMITPVISILGAMEGLEVAAPALEPWIAPITIVILVILFAMQRRGTAAVGVVFGPVILVWFATIAVLGAMSIVKAPGVIAAVDPRYAIGFFVTNGIPGYLALGAIFLVATGGEALYADLGHFGVKPIRIDWFFIVAPALLLNYFGQGALVLRDAETAHNPFYRLAPEWGRVPLLILATVAAVIASQAVISGVFSITRQAVQLGYAPRMEIIHTSAREIGQIYIPTANWALMIATILLVLGFRTSSNIAAAYGVAVTTTMIITTALAFVVARRVWQWRLFPAVVLTVLFLIGDFAFFGANIVKVGNGGWFPLLIGGAVFLLFSTWKRGRDLLQGRLAEHALPADIVVAGIPKRNLPRARGTAVFLTSDPVGAPIALLHNIKHNQIVHERNIFLTVVSEDLPHVPDAERVTLEPLGEGFQRMIARYGFMEDPDVPGILEDMGIDPMQATYILSRDNIVPSHKPRMARWRERLFVFMKRNARDAASYFGLPPNRVVELGMQVEIS